MAANIAEKSNKLSEITVVSMSIFIFLTSIHLLVTLKSEGFIESTAHDARLSIIQEKVAEIEDVETLRSLSILLAGRFDAQTLVADELAGVLRITGWTVAFLSLLQLLNIICIFRHRKRRQDRKGKRSQ